MTLQDLIKLPTQIEIIAELEALEKENEEIKLRAKEIKHRQKELEGQLSDRREFDELIEYKKMLSNGAGAGLQAHVSPEASQETRKDEDQYA